MRGGVWEVILSSEITALAEGVIWPGEADDLVAVIHTKKAAIMLRGGALRAWIMEGQRKWFTERTMALTLENMRMISVYQPQSAHNNNQEAIEEYRREVEIQMQRNERNEVITVCGDHNAHIGRWHPTPLYIPGWHSGLEC